MFFYILLVMAIVGFKLLNDCVITKFQERRSLAVGGATNYAEPKRTLFFKKVEEFLFNDAGIVLIMLILVACLRRDTVGGDLVNYKDYYMAYYNGAADLAHQYFQYEWGYALLNYVCAKIGLPFNVIFIIVDIFFFIVFWLFAKKFSPDVYLSLILMMCLGMFEFSLSGLRQLFAISFMLLGLIFLFKDKIIVYYVFAVIAIFFHASAIFILFFPVFYYLKFKTWVLAALAAVATLCCAFLEEICYIIGKIIGKNFFDYAGKLSNISVFSILWIIGFAALFVLMFVLQKNLSEEVKKEKSLQLFLMMLFCAVLLKFCSIIANFAIMDRLSLYCFLSICFLLPIYLHKMPIITNFKGKNYKSLLLYCMIAVAIIYFILKLALYDSCTIIPYQTILF